MLKSSLKHQSIKSFHKSHFWFSVCYLFGSTDIGLLGYSINKQFIFFYLIISSSSWISFNKFTFYSLFSYIWKIRYSFVFYSISEKKRSKSLRYTQCVLHTHIQIMAALKIEFYEIDLVLIEKIFHQQLAIYT